ncbi:MAG: rhodanese domain protein/phosphatidylserine decarboxylase [Gammaproteobacteria bacterium]|jgi:phosphatidylserine decarboxylase|nr:rhodanese domain protein/phosphatidylserine decarboxylase [Gammaproteobacteria bacterium]
MQLFILNQRLSTLLPVIYQYLLPKTTLSRLAGCLMQSEKPWVAKPLIKWFIRHYHVDLSEALKKSPESYPSFNAFFTRTLEANARPITPHPRAIASPADGLISQYGIVNNGTLIQAKGHSYSVTDLMGGDPKIATPFHHGSFATIYLAPKDYHRVHMPYHGRLTQMIYVPGKLFSVSLKTANGIPHLFARNERVIALFESGHGQTAVVMVGAMLVASVAMEWAGIVNCQHPRKIQQWYYDKIDKLYAKGDYLGHFQLGSTVIVLTEKPLQWENTLTENNTVRMGQALAYYS